jgi:diguanylate cyclase (GGDEF)-like protein/PAS domain S-box-containing protein
MNNDEGRMMTFKIVIIYLVIGSAWILFSDQSLLLATDSDVWLPISLVKQWLFIAFTSCVLYGLISFYMKRIFQAQMKEQQVSEELLAVHEELVVSEEELRMQVEELNSNDSKLSRQNVVLEALHETTLGLMDRRSMEELLSKLVSSATKLANTDNGYYNAIDLQTGSMERKVGCGIYACDVGRKMSIKAGLIAEVIRTGTNQIVADYSQWDKRLSDSFFDQVRSEMQVPLKIANQIIGVIGMSYVEQEQRFAPIDVQTFQHFAEIAMIALTNASQYEQVQREIGDRMKAEEQAKVSEGERQQAAEELQLWGLVFENTGAAIFLTDGACRMVAVNRSFQQITGYQSNETLHRQPRVFEFVHENEDFQTNLTKLLKEYNFWQGELWVRRKDGSRFPSFVSISCMQQINSDISHYLITFFDISEKKAAEQRIHDLVNFDILTGLPNRRLLQERMGLAMAQCHGNGSKMAVLFLDLDRFKTVNDSLGHDLGDLLLKDIGRRLNNSVSREDTVSRQNADEFIIVLTQITDCDQVQGVATSLLAIVATPCLLEGTEVVTCATIGISIYPDDGKTSAVLLKNAETAMSHAKKNNYGGCQFFTASLNHIIAERLEIESSLRKAIYNDEFVLYYQPQIDLVTGGVVGVEALIRWQHPVQGLIAPGKFISIAEATGLIIPIGEWVIKEVCRQSQLWQQRNLVIPIALNISAVQFMQADFCNRMEMILLRTGVDPCLLEIELTESVVMKDADQTINELKRLKELGLRLSIDDFGTGYSSLSYLRRFPIDRLKIDQSFVRYMTTDKASLAIIDAIIALGHSLGLTVIAEGVETELELNMLRQRNCQEVQGYYFARPMLADQLTALFAEGKLHSFQS